VFPVTVFPVTVDRVTPVGRGRQQGTPDTVGAKEAAEMDSARVRDQPVRGRARIRRARRTTARVLRNRADILAVIAVGGAFGSLARWGLTLLRPAHPGRFPWATLTANVTGALALGVLMVFVLDVWPPSRYARPFFGTGVLGGYTTFSTAMLDTRAQLVAGRPGQAAAYLFGGLAAGLFGVWLGMAVARAVVVGVRERAARRREAGADHGTGTDTGTGHGTGTEYGTGHDTAVPTGSPATRRTP
jgi:CrcB protein